MALVGHNADAAALGGNIADFCAAVVDGHGGAGGIARRHGANVALVEQGACADGHGGAGFNGSRRALRRVVDAHAGAGLNIAHRVRVLDGGGADGDRGAGLDKLSLVGRHASLRSASNVHRGGGRKAADGAGVDIVVPHGLGRAVALADGHGAGLRGHAADLGALRVAVNGHAADRRKVAQHALVAHRLCGRLLRFGRGAHRDGAGRGQVADFPLVARDRNGALQRGHVFHGAGVVGNGDAHLVGDVAQGAGVVDFQRACGVDRQAFHRGAFQNVKLHIALALRQRQSADFSRKLRALNVSVKAKRFGGGNRDRACDDAVCVILAADQGARIQLLAGIAVRQHRLPGIVVFQNQRQLAVEQGVVEHLAHNAAHVGRSSRSLHRDVLNPAGDNVVLQIQPRPKIRRAQNAAEVAGA